MNCEEYYYFFLTITSLMIIRGKLAPMPPRRSVLIFIDRTAFRVHVFMHFEILRSSTRRPPTAANYNYTKRYFFVGRQPNGASAGRGVRVGIENRPASRANGTGKILIPFYTCGKYSETVVPKKTKRNLYRLHRTFICRTTVAARAITRRTVIIMIRARYCSYYISRGVVSFRLKMCFVRRLK